LWPARCYLTRPHRCGKIQPSCDSRTHLPCSRLHARLAGDITVTAGRLLPYPFTPDRLNALQASSAALLSVAVVVTMPLPALRPHLLFHGAIVLMELPRSEGSREVPLPALAGSDDLVVRIWLSSCIPCGFGYFAERNSLLYYSQRILSN
jgi:hypothetical protein